MPTTTKTRAAKQLRTLDLSDPKTVVWFRKVAKASTGRATRSKKTALDTLIAEGIYTKSGRLSKNYR